MFGKDLTFGSKPRRVFEMNLLNTLRNAVHEAEKLQKSEEQKLSLLIRLNHHLVPAKDLRLKLKERDKMSVETLRHLSFLAYFAGGYNANCPDEKYNGHAGHLAYYLGDDKTVEEAIKELIVQIGTQY